MELKKIIDVAKEIRPGNNWDSEIVKHWISELDAEIQLEVCHKPIDKVIKLIPDKWEHGKKYAAGDRVSVRDGGDWKIYRARIETVSEPNTDQTWESVPTETYVGAPHDKIYYLYIIAMMDYANEVYDKYANDYAVYNAALDEFAKWWQRQYRYRNTEEYDEYYKDRCARRS